MQVVNWFLRRMFKYLAPLISILENKKIKKYSNQKPNHSPIFIIGPPRSGSTILYQIITNYFNVNYIDNVVHLSRENIFFGFWLGNLFFKNKNHNTFRSDYGNTQKYGLHAPSEGGNIWYRWFSKDKVYFEKGSLPDKKMNEFRNNINAILTKFNKPLIIKNLMFSQRIEVLFEAFPNAKFIFIKRLPEYNAQSIYKARLKNTKNEWWSTRPKNYKELLSLPLTQQSVSQVYYIEKQIQEDLKLVPSENIFKINYEDLVINCELVMNNIREFIGEELKPSLSNIKIESENSVKIEQKDFNLILDLVKKFDWKNYQTL